MALVGPRLAECGQAVRPLADPEAPHSQGTNKPDKWWGVKQTEQPKAPARGNKASNLSENTRGGCGGSRRDSQPHRRGPWRDPQGTRACTSPPTREPAPEGPSLIVGDRVEDWSPVESEVGAIAPSRPLPHVQHHSAATKTKKKKKKKKRPKWQNTSKLQKKYN